MTNQIDFGRLAALIRAKRNGRGLREIADEMGDVSPSTLSRIEGERVNDMSLSTFLSLCNWLQINPAELILDAPSGTSPKLSEQDELFLQLRASKQLSPKTAEMLAEMLRAAYEKARDIERDDQEIED